MNLKYNQKVLTSVWHTLAMFVSYLSLPESSRGGNLFGLNAIGHNWIEGGNILFIIVCIFTFLFTQKSRITRITCITRV